MAAVGIRANERAAESDAIVDESGDLNRKMERSLQRRIVVQKKEPSHLALEALLYTFSSVALVQHNMLGRKAWVMPADNSRAASFHW